MAMKAEAKKLHRGADDTALIIQKITNQTLLPHKIQCKFIKHYPCTNKNDGIQVVKTL
jgi:hypothetical protein